MFLDSRNLAQIERLQRDNLRWCYRACLHAPTRLAGVKCWCLRSDVQHACQKHRPQPSHVTCGSTPLGRGRSTFAVLLNSTSLLSPHTNRCHVVGIASAAFIQLQIKQLQGHRKRISQIASLHDSGSLQTRKDALHTG